MFDGVVTTLAGQTGLSEDVTRFLVAFLAEIPVALLTRLVPNVPALKHLLFGLIGILVSFFVYGNYTYLVFVTMIPVYLIMRLSPNRLGARISFVVCFGFLLVLHAYRMATDYLGYTLDFSSVQMVLTIKFTTFAWSVSNANDPTYVCSKHTEAHKIMRLPTPLEFFGFTFFFPAFFSGPSLEFRNYMDFITMDQFEVFGKHYPPLDLKKIAEIVVLILVMTGLFFGLGSIHLDQLYHFYVIDNASSTLLVVKLLFIYLFIEFIKLRYYLTWKFAELLGVLLGFGFSGMVDNKPTWNAFCNVKIWNMETARALRDIVSNWNIQTETWLRYCLRSPE